LLLIILICLYCNYCDCDLFKPLWPLFKKLLFTNVSRFYVKFIVFMNIVRWCKKEKENRYSFNQSICKFLKIFWFHFDPLLSDPKKKRCLSPGRVTLALIILGSKWNQFQLYPFLACFHIWIYLWAICVEKLKKHLWMLQIFWFVCIGP